MSPPALSTTAWRPHGWPWWLLPLAIFFALIAIQIDLPGLYMDAVNPDFLAASLLHHTLHNPTAGLPSKTLPLLGNLYYGTQNVYAGLPLFVLFGFKVATLRVAQALFGALLLVALYRTAWRLTGSALLALLCAAGVASDLAFTASFRTQFYIVLGGAAWLFVSLALAAGADAAPDARRRLLWSGVFAGLAGYGYFVLLFFVPGVIAWLVLRRRAGWRDLWLWLPGVAIGLTPFALGYLSLALRLHGVGAAVAYAHGLIAQLHPFQAGGASGGNLDYALQVTRLAVSDDANETMIFGQPLGSSWGAFKFYLLLVLMALSVVLLVLRWKQRDVRAQGLLVVCLPLSFMVVASLFGHRLWAHHFSVLVPFTYLLAAVALAPWLAQNRVANPRGVRHGAWLAASLALACVVANLAQQVTFHHELARTGGGPKMPEALNTLAMEARQAPPSVAYVFPEWGFYTSFGFLTANRVRYVVDIDPATLTRLRQQGYRTFRVAYWNDAESDRYRQALAQAGVTRVSERTFLRRDGQTAFHLLEGQ